MRATGSLKALKSSNPCKISSEFEPRYTKLEPHERLGTNLAAKIAARYLTTAQITAKMSGRCGLKSLSIRCWIQQLLVEYGNFSQQIVEPPVEFDSYIWSG